MQPQSLNNMNYPPDLFFDIETLINVAQPKRIILLGDCDSGFLDNYIEQKQLLNQACEVTHITMENIDSFWQLDERFDVGLVINLFEHIDKITGQRILSRLRDVMCPQYCLALPLATQINNSKTLAINTWQLTDLFSFALSKVASYTTETTEYGLFKYNISDYKKTPDWLNADNWANPQMWGKYWW